MIVSQVWRDAQGRQARLARLLTAIDVQVIDEAGGRAAGLLLGQAGTSDPVDATIVLLARAGDRIITSDPEDIGHLAVTAQLPAVIVVC